MFIDVYMGYTSKIDLLAALYVPAVSPNRPLLYPDETGVERSGSRDFSAQISHTQPSGSMVRVLIAPPISRRTAEISRGGPKYPRIGAFPPGRLGLWILVLCLDGRYGRSVSAP